MNTQTIDDMLVISLPKRMDATTISQIEGDLDAAVKAHRGNVLIDMADTSFFASLAMRLLLTLLKDVQQRGYELRLSGLQPQILDIFRKSRFDSLFTIVPDRESGLRPSA